MPDEVPDRSALPPTGPFERINSLCESFSSAWQPGAKGAFDEYLAQVAENAQPTLLRNLLHVEIERRRACGEQPNAEEYIRKFPQHAALIREAFLDSSSSAFHSASGETPRSQPRAAGTPVANRLGEYQLVRELGRGGMGAVYEAVHVRRGNRVALKTLPLADGPRLHLFKREFRALADVNHPNLVGLHTLEADGGQWFLTMDLLQGENFLRHVRPGGTLDEARLRRGLTQLVTGVMTLHSKHVIHRDLKPSNVMVSAEGRVIILDFGLVLEEDHSWSSDKVAGTPRYMAPEQAAGRALTTACDWYAVGVMLYEALCGKSPFAGSAVQVLQDKQRLDPPPLAAEGIPADLAALAMGLLAREPEQRPDPLGIVKAVAGQSEPSGRLASGQHLVGREQQLAALQDAFRALRKRQEPLTVFIHGRSGEGKTTLAEHFLELLRRDRGRVVVMSGRCYDRESVPFKALDSLIDALASYLRSLSGEDAALLLPKDIGVLVQVFPVLQRVHVVEKAPRARTAGLDEQQVRQRAFAALRELLWRISDKTPIVWCIDDLQWGDADSAEALFGVLRPPEAPVVLFLGTYRSDEAEGSPFLKAWEELKRKHDVQLERRDVGVGPLSEEQCVELVVGLLGRASEAIRRRAEEFARETRGNPFLLIELVGCFDPESDSFQSMPLHEVLARKLGRLPSEALELLKIVAVSGQALPLADAARAAGHEHPPMLTLSKMRNERLVRLMGSEDQPSIDTYHDRVRETVRAELDEPSRRGLHRTLAEVIETNAGVDVPAVLAALAEDREHEQPVPRVYDLAFHFDAAGEGRKALAYSLLAAEQAGRQSALEVATQQYAIAGRNCDEGAKAIRFRIDEGVGEALMLLGRYEEAHARLEGAIDLVEDSLDTARIEGLQGDLALKQGKIDDSILHYQSGLRRLGHWVPKSRVGLAYSILRETLVQCWHTWFPGRLHRRKSTSEGELIIHLLARHQVPQSFSNPFWWLWTHLVSMNRAELLPPSTQLVYATAAHGTAMSMLGWQGRGKRYGQKAIGLADQFDNLWYLGTCNSYAGIGCVASARFEEGLPLFAKAITTFEKAGDLWEVNLAHFHKGCCHFGLGDLAGAIAEAKTIFGCSARIGDSRVFCASYLWARATRGNFPFEELRSCYPNRPDDVMSTVHGVMAEGHWHTFHGRTKEALEAFQRAASRVWETMCVNSHMILTLPELAGAMRRHADAVEKSAPKECAHLRKRSHTLANRAAWITRLFPAAYPQSLRELALILDARGKTKKALKYATKSCAVAEKQKAKYEHAQSSLVRARLAKQLGLPEADVQIRDAEAAIEEIERPVREATH